VSSPGKDFSFLCPVLSCTAMDQATGRTRGPLPACYCGSGNKFNNRSIAVGNENSNNSNNSNNNSNSNSNNQNKGGDQNNNNNNNNQNPGETWHPKDSKSVPRPPVTPERSTPDK
jgi:hypothetical protein